MAEIPLTSAAVPEKSEVVSSATVSSLTPAETERVSPPIVLEGWDPRKTKQSLRAARSYNCYPFDQVISAVQKSVRRGWVYDAVYWALEAFFAGVGATRTNIWNRLLVMSVEDIGPANPLLLPLIFHHFRNYRDDAYSLARCVYLLAISKKTRINDWVAVYNSFPELGKICPGDKEVGAKITELAPKIGTAEEVKNQLVEALRKRNLAESARLIKLLRFHPERLDVRLRAEMGIIIAFHEVVGNDSEYLKVCEELALSPNWKWKSTGPEGKTLLVYNQMATLWCCGKWKDAETSIPRNTAGSVDEDAYMALTQSAKKFTDPLVDEHEAGNMELLGIPDVALDKHTGRGKVKKRGLDYFMNVGSVLVNEDPKWQELSEWYKSRVTVC